MDNLFIAISGIIGVGKSTLAEKLAEVMKLPVYYEPVCENEYLEDFYKDMTRFSFPLQVYLLNNRFEQHQQIIWQGKGGVQDRSIFEDTIFAKVLCDQGHLSEREYRTYLSLFHNMSNFMRKPNLIVHLDVSPEESLRRIQLRARDCETGITLDYLRALHAAYEDFILDISRFIPVIRVNWLQFQSTDDMAAMIQSKWQDMRNIQSVDWVSPVSISSPLSSPSHPVSE